MSSVNVRYAFGQSTDPNYSRDIRATVRDISRELRKVELACDVTLHMRLVYNKHDTFSYVSDEYFSDKDHERISMYLLNRVLTLQYRIPDLVLTTGHPWYRIHNGFISVYKFNE